MTVSSLWKALDRAGCGTAVGTSGFVTDHRGKSGRNPWNFSERHQQTRPLALAIDLSIWICESLNSPASSKNHAEPALHLVFTRTVKLLNLGVKVVAVLEGKRRHCNLQGDTMKIQRRRTGSRFWKACHQCEKILQFLGVYVVSAKAEGEALCALLNMHGIVDGVISNDGDCFLFGAKIVYTKFSLENLQRGKVMRYDVDQMEAFVDDDDSDKFDRGRERDHRGPVLETVKLSRTDLIAFAVLTGSDVSGDGIPNVGCRKALRFIRKCQLDNPKNTENSAFAELISWSKATRIGFGTNHTDQCKKWCSSCGHIGSKSCHFKSGCKQCGTEPGEPCFPLSPGGKFRKLLRAKVLEMPQRFDPQSVADIYLRPNDNHIPLEFLGKSPHKLEMKPPDLNHILLSKLIIRGRSLTESRSYVIQALSGLIVKFEMSRQHDMYNKCLTSSRQVQGVNNVQPSRIIKVTRKFDVDYFEVLWLFKTNIGEKELPTEKFTFSTTEKQKQILNYYPALVMKFQEDEKLRTKQGNTEQEKRRVFLASMVRMEDDIRHKEGQNMYERKSRKKRGCRVFFKSGNNFPARCLDTANKGQHLSDLVDNASTKSVANEEKVDDDKKVPSTINISNKCSCLGHDSVDVSPMGSFKSNEPRSQLHQRHESPYKLTSEAGHLYFLGLEEVGTKSVIEASTGVNCTEEKQSMHGDLIGRKEIGVERKEFHSGSRHYRYESMLLQNSARVLQLSWTSADGIDEKTRPPPSHFFAKQCSHMPEERRKKNDAVEVCQKIRDLGSRTHFEERKSFSPTIRPPRKRSRGISNGPTYGHPTSFSTSDEQKVNNNRVSNSNTDKNLMHRFILEISNKNSCTSRSAIDWTLKKSDYDNNDSSTHSMSNEKAVNGLLMSQSSRSGEENFLTRDFLNPSAKQFKSYVTSEKARRAKLDDNGIIEAATAKLEAKVSLARLDSEYRELLEEGLGNFPFVIKSL